jgi:CubicO group peptidase (beta-lactamase class C family)
MKKQILFSLFILFFLTGFSQSKKLIPAAKPEDVGLSSERLKRIDYKMQELVDNKSFPGVAVMIVRNGKIAYSKAYGTSDISGNTPMQKDAIFRIASQTKAITSTAVMMLFEEGKFLLDDPVSKYIPEFKEPKLLDKFNPADSRYTTKPATGEITIRQLLTHTSGLDYSAVGSNEFKAIYAKAKVPSGIGTSEGKLADKMKVLGGLPLKHNPGERYTYGLNSDVLGYLIEVLSGMSLNDYFKTRIFTPLEMSDTYFYLPKEKQGRLVAVHTSTDTGIKKVETSIYDNVNPLYPTTEGTYFSGGAGLSSTMEDYAKFLQMFLNGGEYNGKRLLSRKTIELMLTNQTAELTEQMGLGFGLETIKNDSKSILTTGSFMWGGAFNTMYWADPKEKLIGLVYTQMYYGKYWQLGDIFKILTYQSITD